MATDEEQLYHTEWIEWAAGWLMRSHQSAGVDSGVLPRSLMSPNQAVSRQLVWSGLFLITLDT